MTNRSYIERSIQLCGESDSGRFLRTFRIRDRISAEGASAVCYAAEHDQSGSGVLKEFYPAEIGCLSRDAGGQLICLPGNDAEKAAYEEMMREYVEPYRMMLEMRRRDELASFIPPFEIYYGCDSGLNIIGTAYIWSPEPKLETFDKMCREIHEHPAEMPEHKLVRVLYSVESLIKCVCALHCADLLHRDIKPSNFGFVKRGREVLTQSVSLFDIDTVCSVYNVPKETVRGSAGFLEPEAMTRPANNLTDIYAIGATLFYAVIVNDELRNRGFLYDGSMYSRLKELVDTSELITDSEMNSHPRLRALLTRILQKTLCPRNKRYQCCEELLEDVQKALYYVVPAEITDRGSPGEHWVLTDVDSSKALDPKRERNSAFAIQYHLYTEPVCAGTPADKKTLDVLLIGFGQYGQKYLDIVLQTVQIPGKSLNVRVVSSSREDKAVYLADRPALADFFDIDGSLEKGAESYGTVRFTEHTLDTGAPGANAGYLERLFADTGFEPDCAFIATGRDSQNLAIAGALASSLKCRVSAVLEGKKHLSKKELGGIQPIYMSDDISRYPAYPEIERMAFNVHLIWKKDLNSDYSEMRKSFRRPYEHRACVSFVISMRYKLLMTGTDPDADSAENTAETYKKYLAGNEAARDRLVYFEHRRWVTEKLCLGYTRISDLNECAGGVTRDEKRKRHICIVRSTPSKGLRSAEWLTDKGQTDRGKWDSPSESDLAGLDELDRLSVELHLMHLKQAAAESRSNLLSGEIVSALREQTGRDSQSLTALNELLTCMKDIWTGDAGQCRRYSGLMSSFTDCVKASEVMNDRERRSALKLTDSLKERFYPVFASREYRDYKLDDAALVEGIPFILTYTDQAAMLIPFRTGSASRLFTALAAATACNPAKIVYALFCEKPSDLAAAKASLPRLAAYMKKKEFRAGVEFIIGYNEKENFRGISSAETEFRTASGGRVTKVTAVNTDPSGLAEYIRDMLKAKRGRNRNRTLLEINGSELSEVFSGAGLYREFPSYRFDAGKMKFIPFNDCGAVKHIGFRPYITVTDMLPLRRSAEKPEFFGGYKELWSRYISSADSWERLTGLLAMYAAENDILARFSFEASPSPEKTYSYIVPTASRQNVSLIIEALKAERLIGGNSGISGRTPGSCLAVIKDRFGRREQFDSLFSKVNILVQPGFVRCETDPETHAVSVLYNDLTVRELDCSGLSGKAQELLKFFGDRLYLTGLRYDSAAEKACFTYATPQIKDLLTVGGRLLEIYVYHRLRETGEFDDIRSGSETDWGGCPAESAFDCVLTKGFTSVFIKCGGAGTDHAKLAETAQRYGIDPVAVLIDGSPFSAPAEKSGVTVVSGTEQISDIGNTVLKLLENRG